MFESRREELDDQWRSFSFCGADKGRELLDVVAISCQLMRNYIEGGFYAMAARMPYFPAAAAFSICNVRLFVVCAIVVLEGLN